MATYKGKKVTSRDIAKGEPEFDANTPKVRITPEGGGPEQVVPKAEVQA